MAKGWLITGGSSGLGLSLGRTVIAKGCTAVLTTRNVSSARNAAPDIEEKGGHWLQLDFSSDELEQVVKDAVLKFDIGVIVNNAGYALGGPVEDMSAEAIRTQYEANLVAPIRLIQAVAPIFRERKQGTIANIGSSVSYSPMPAVAVYASTKAALRTITQGLAIELGSFGIRVLLFEPGRFRTAFGSHGVWASSNPQGFSDPYKGTPVDQVLGFLKNAPPAAGDPDKAALRMWEVVTRTGMAAAVLEKKGAEEMEVARIPLGTDAVEGVAKAGTEWSEVAKKTEEIAKSTDF